MPVTFSRVLGAIAVILAIVVWLHASPERESDAASGPSSTHGTNAGEVRSSASHYARMAPHEPPMAGRPVATHDPPSTSAFQATAGSQATPIQLEVSVPRAVSALDPFEASVRIAADDGIHRLRFVVVYNRKLLALTGVSPGDFTQTGAVPADLTTDEPSDGNLEVTYTVRDGHALKGSGTIAVLHFEPQKSGTARIAIPNMTAFDSAGSVRFQADAPHSVSVEVQ